MKQIGDVRVVQRHVLLLHLLQKVYRLCDGGERERRDGNASLVPTTLDVCDAFAVKVI